MSDWKRLGVREVGVAVSVLAAVAIAGTQISGALKAPAWVLVVLYVLAGVGAIGSILIDWRSGRRGAREARIRQLRDSLALFRGSSPDESDPPTVEESDPYRLGVSRSRYEAGSDPYVRREEVDDRLDKQLRARSFVLVVGDSKAGKSRTAFEAIRRVYRTSKLLVPKARSGAIQGLLSLDPPLDRGPNKAVVWLDDIERYLVIDGGLDPGLLGQMEANAVVVATIRSKARNALLATEGEIGRSARAVLEHGTPEIYLDSELRGEDELADARRSYPEEDFTRGIGEQLVAAPELERKYRDGRDSHPAGWSVVQAAIDWSRTGMSNPIPKPLLQDLYPAYLRQLRSDLDPSDQLFQDGLTWAREPVAARIALLHIRNEVEPPAFTAFDYIIAYADGQGDSPGDDVLDAAWDIAIESGDSRDRFTIGLVAYARGAHTAAANAWRRMAPDHVLLSEEGDPKGAAEAFKRAIDAGEFFAPSGGAYLTVDRVTDPNGAPADVIDVDLGFTVGGTVALPNWLAGTATVCIWADEQGGTFDRALSPCATITLTPSNTEPNPKVYPWSISFSGNVLPAPSSGSQIYHLLAMFMYNDQATDIAGFADMGLYLVN